MQQSYGIDQFRNINEAINAVIPVYKSDEDKVQRISVNFNDANREINKQVSTISILNDHRQTDRSDYKEESPDRNKRRMSSKNPQVQPGHE